VTFPVIFGTAFILSWMLCGSLAWLVFSIATRGRAGLPLLPASAAVGVVGGISVPLLLRDDAWGIPISLVVAVMAPAVFLAARRYSLPTKGERAVVPSLPKDRPE
jgi:NhaP-type Na+/H+ or K+/H+ antiporter